jgi:NAD(P)-dependent dehydrogenase (short-subunit alcohol dehydrogenase family)
MSTLEVNVNGAQIVTAAFLPLLRKRSRKLVVNV